MGLNGSGFFNDYISIEMYKLAQPVIKRFCLSSDFEEIKARVSLFGKPCNIVLDTTEIESISPDLNLHKIEFTYVSTSEYDIISNISVYIDISMYLSVLEDYNSESNHSQITLNATLDYKMLGFDYKDLKIKFDVDIIKGVKVVIDDMSALTSKFMFYPGDRIRLGLNVDAYNKYFDVSDGIFSIDFEPFYNLAVNGFDSLNNQLCFKVYIEMLDVDMDKLVYILENLNNLFKHVNIIDLKLSLKDLDDVFIEEKLNQILSLLSFGENTYSSKSTLTILYYNGESFNIFGKFRDALLNTYLGNVVLRRVW